MAEGSERKNVYISLHEAFVREGIQYTDRKTGEQRTFNVARLPSDTFIDGKDVGGYEFSPLYVNPSRFRGEHWRDIPLLADREVRLSRSVLDAEGRPVIGEDGRRAKDTLTVAPAQIRDALSEARRRYAEEHALPPLPTLRESPSPTRAWRASPCPWTGRGSRSPGTSRRGRAPRPWRSRT